MKILSSNQVLVEFHLDADDVVELSKSHKLCFKRTFENLPVEYKGNSLEFCFVISLKSFNQASEQRDAGTCLSE